MAAVTAGAFELILRARESIDRTCIQQNGSHNPASDQPIRAGFDASSALSMCSPDGHWLAIADKDGIDIYDCEATPATHARRIAQMNVSTLGFSPLGNFLLTWHRKQDTEPNLQAWSIRDGSLRGAWHHKNNAELWPPIRWSGDEGIAVKAGADEIYVYDGSLPDTVVRARMSLVGVQRAWVSPNAHTHAMIVGFSPRTKNKPAAAVTWAYPRVSEPSSARSLQADSARVEFSPDGGYALIEMSTDSSADSYYGDSRLFLASRDGRVSVAVNHPKEGSSHDFAWSPKSDTFLFIGGRSPPVAALYNKNGALQHNFGAGGYNTVRFSPNGRVVMLGGFGNMGGDVNFFDVAKRTSLGTANSPCTVTAEWAPDSRLMLTTTTRPRLQVDNGFRVWDYHGRCLAHRPFEQLYGAFWRPAPRSTFPDRAPSPEPKGGAAAAGEVGGVPAPVAPPKARGTYRPPGARGVLGGGLDSPTPVSIVGTSYIPGGVSATALMALAASGGSRVPVGAAAPAMSASQRKRMKAREKKATGGGDGDGGDGDGGGGLGEEETVNEASSGTAPKAAPTLSPGEGQDDASLSPEEASKLYKKLVKKMGEIAALKKSAAAGTALDAAQVAKVAGEAELTARLQTLQLQVG